MPEQRFIPDSERPIEAFETPEDLRYFAERTKAKVNQESQSAIKAGENRIAAVVPKEKIDQGKAALSETQENIKKLAYAAEAEINEVLK